ncbi:MAG: hypothetical protein P8Y54_14535 [Xanthomonadales bacterium]
MKRTLRAGFVYFLIVFTIGFVLGSLRVLVVAPRIGELAAVLVELPVMLLAAWIVCSALTTRFRVARNTRDRIIMGGHALALLLIAEIALSKFVFGNPMGSIVAAYLTPHGFVGLCGQLAFAVFPLLQLARR